MFRIGEFSRLANTSVRMLRHYDKLALLIPEKIDEMTGYRYYTAAQLAKVNRIQRLKGLGFSLAVVGEILNNATREELEGFFHIREKELQEELAKITQQSAQLAKAIEIMKEETNTMEYNVILKEMPERKVIGLRRTIPAYRDEGTLWEDLYAEIQRQNVKMKTPPLNISVYYDEEYKERDVDVEVQVSVEGDYQDTAEVKVFTVPRMQVAAVTFHGSYEHMSGVSEAVAQWMETNGYRMDGPMFNIFHVSPAQDPNPDNWVTEACYRVVAIEK